MYMSFRSTWTSQNTVMDESISEIQDEKDCDMSGILKDILRTIKIPINRHSTRPFIDMFVYDLAK